MKVIINKSIFFKLPAGAFAGFIIGSLCKEFFPDPGWVCIAMGVSWWLVITLVLLIWE